MGYYDVAQICLNGHCITDSANESPQFTQNFCDRCGASTITACPECGVQIRGYYHSTGILDLTKYTVPSYCPHCGNPYPWTKSALAAVAELVAEDEKMAETAKVALIDSLPDAVSETPRTNLAAVRIKKAFSAAGHFTVEGLRQFAIDFGCEMLKSQLGL